MVRVLGEEKRLAWSGSGISRIRRRRAWNEAERTLETLLGSCVNGGWGCIQRIGVSQWPGIERLPIGGRRGEMDFASASLQASALSAQNV